ncbi:NAD(P)-binding protein [Coniochaeta hoffmannii]|uniref:NAD(P)-binding protein n=1 Tax=Coniochaeta hoffmannii TaxID=91930 RepID=A0AA38W0S2_9PEZI|nr:NAD(P)-binding protein [Coniochaeta hoffmannii]
MTRTVLITGCSDGGIGSALTKRFAASGFKVFATARSVSKMSALNAVPNITLLELNVRSVESMTAALKAVSVETGGRLDYLVNNAGVAYRTAALEAEDRIARELFDVNFWGIVDMCRIFGPPVIKAKGTIVNISSLSGIGVPMLWNSIYSASKAAVDAYSNTLRLELSPFDVRVVTVVPGAVETNMNSSHVLAPSTLPAGDSLFKPAEKHIAKANIPDRMSVDLFAEKVVADVLGGATGRVWRGAFTSCVWAIMTFCPRAVLDKLVTQNQGLELLGKK